MRLRTDKAIKLEALRFLACLSGVRQEGRETLLAAYNDPDYEVRDIATNLTRYTLPPGSVVEFPPRGLPR